MSKPIDGKGMQVPPEPRDIEVPRELETCPFVHAITVHWGDCDPAQIAYTARIPGWALAAIEAWYKACLGVNWYEINFDLGIGTPFVQLGFDFRAPITPRFPLDCAIYVSRLGTSSLSHVVEGVQAGRCCFVGRTTSAFVEASRMRPLPIPENMRESIRRYMAAQGRSFQEAAAENG